MKIFKTFFAILIAITILSFPRQSFAETNEEIEAVVLRDIKDAERLVLLYFGVAKAPHKDMEVLYDPDRSGVAAGREEDGRKVVFNKEHYAYGHKQFPYSGGFADFLFPPEVFSGTVHYLHINLHEPFHLYRQFEEDVPIIAGQCGRRLRTSGWSMLAEGVPKFVSLEIMLKRGKELNDPAHERYVTRIVSVYLAVINYLGKVDYTLDDLPITLPLSEQARHIINERMRYFSEKKAELPEGTQLALHSSVVRYAFGWLGVYLWKAEFPNDDLLRTNSAQKFFCSMQSEQEFLEKVGDAAALQKVKRNQP